MKWYCSFENGKMTIQELSDRAYSRQPEFQKRRGTYEGVSVYDSLKEAIKGLGGYSHDVTLPDGSTIIPSEENYNMPIYAYVGNVWVEIL